MSNGTSTLYNYNILAQNYNSFIETFYDFFADPIPENLTFQYTDPNNGPETANVPNLLQIQNNIISNLSDNLIALETYDISVYVPGQYVSNEVINQTFVPRDITIPVSFTGSGAYAGIAPTNNSTLTILVNNTNEIATVVFNATTNLGIIAQNGTGEISIPSGSILDIVAPSTVDQTLANVSVTIAATTTITTYI